MDWHEGKGGEEMDEAGRKVEERTGKGSGCDPLDNSPMLAGRVQHADSSCYIPYHYPVTPCSKHSLTV